MYYDLEPFGELRDDYRIGSVVQMLYNINRGKNQKALTLEEAVIKFGEQVTEKQKQNPSQQLAMLKILAAMHSGGGETQAPDPGPGTVTFSDAEQQALFLAKKAMN